MEQRNLDEIKKSIKTHEIEKLGDRVYKNIQNNNSSKKRKYQKKKLIKKLVSTTLIATMSFNLGIVSVHANQLHQGANNIANEFVEYTKGYEIVPKAGGGAYIKDPDGLSIITFGIGENISMEPAYHIMIEEYEKSGATKAEEYIAVKKVYGKDAADKYVGEVSKEELKEAKQKAYHEAQLNEYSNGGITR